MNSSAQLATGRAGSNWLHAPFALFAAEAGEEVDELALIAFSSTPDYAEDHVLSMVERRVPGCWLRNDGTGLRYG